MNKSLLIFPRRDAKCIDVLFISIYELLEFYKHNSFWKKDSHIWWLVAKSSVKLLKNHKTSLFNKRDNLRKYTCRICISTKDCTGIKDINKILKDIEQISEINNWDIYYKKIAGYCCNYHETVISNNLTEDMKIHYYQNYFGSLFD